MNFELLKKRAAIIQAVRRFFIINGYLEVETPLRIPAPIPEAYIDLFESEEWFLQSSPEICMKRLAAHGCNKIFQICKCFRKDERSNRHLTELTMLEWYSPGNTYMDLMDQCQNLIRYIAVETYHQKNMQINKNSETIPDTLSVRNFSKIYEDTKTDPKPELNLCYNDETIRLSEPWQKITVKQAFSQYASVSMEQALLQNNFDYIMGFEIEPNLGKHTPTFIFDYPFPLASLAKLKSDNKKIAERFEFYIAGIELANGFSELIDPIEQRKRFENDIEIRKKLGKKIAPMPEKFIDDLRYLPETAGIALGIDRLVMLFTDSYSIDDVVAFTPEEL